MRTRVQVSRLIKDAANLWNYLREQAGLDTKTYDADIVHEVRARLSLPPRWNLGVLLKEGNISTEDLIVAFFQSVQPYAEMMSDILLMNRRSKKRGFAAHWPQEVFDMKGYVTKLLVLSALFLTALPCGSEELEIHCLSVGKADCTIVKSPTGKVMMIDAAWTSTEPHVCGYLDTLDVDTIHYLIITHYHRDHIGGADAIWEEFVVDSLFDRGWEYCKSDYNKYDSILHDRRSTVEVGHLFDLGGDAFARVVCVNGGDMLTPPFLDEECGGNYSENDLCVAMVIEFGGFRFFVGGDLSGSNADGYKNIESHIAENVGRIDVYQVNHHGSQYSTNDSFLTIIDPSVAILSARDNVGNTHPHTSVLERLRSTCDSVFMTVRSGDIVVRTTGYESFTVNEASYSLEDVSVDDDCPQVPEVFKLHMNYPNPFNQQTTITYSVKTRCHVRMSVYNVLGQKVATLVSRMHSAGMHTIGWDGADHDGRQVASGIYLYRIEAGDFEDTRKMVLLK